MATVPSFLLAVVALAGCQTEPEVRSEVIGGWWLHGTFTANATGDDRADLRKSVNGTADDVTDYEEVKFVVHGRTAACDGVRDLVRQKAYVAMLADCVHEG